MRFILTVLSFVLLGANVYSQDKGRAVELNTEPGSALKVTLTGKFNLDWVYRGPIINEASFWQRSGSISSFGLNTGESATDFNDGQDILNGQLLLNLKAELQNKISIVTNFGNLRARRAATNPVTDNLNFGDPSSRDSTKLLFFDLYGQFDEFVDPAVSLKVGQITSYNIDWTGSGNPLLIGFSGGAESPWTTGESLIAWPETRRDSVLPSGIITSYTKDVLEITLALLPYVVSAGEDRAFSGNEGVYLLNGNYKLASDGSNKIGGMFGFLRGPNNIDTITTSDVYDGSTVWVFGAGTKLGTVVPNFTFFGEAYWEFGDLVEAKATSATVDDIEINAYAFNVGAKYSFTSEVKPWVEVSMIYVTGEDDSSSTNGDLSKNKSATANDDSSEFISYESNNDFLIVENQLFGLDIDNNYWGLKFKGGITSGKVSLTGKLGLFQMIEDVLVGSSEEDKLGTELDLLVEYMLNESASFTAGLGYLFGSDVMELYTSDTDDKDYLFMVGTKIKF
ncbi:MAG: hypothetical protein HY606_08165 [Planctomycetes bacterium]|nr:hypothetical protein [Planctomycetota bacterium]